MRPTERPSTPHGPLDIIHLTRQHFLVEQHTRCAARTYDCIYGDIPDDPKARGCGVGHMMILEDARSMDPTGSFGTSKEVGTFSVKGIREKHKDLYDIYFKDSDQTLSVLRNIQSIHDCSLLPSEFYSHLQNYLDNKEKELLNV